MKRILGVLTVTTLAVGSMGCATAPKPQPDLTADIDLVYVNAVERAAKQFGTQIVWINMPRKRTSN